jgi:hypothetical protein
MRASANAWTLVVPLFAAIAVLATFVVGTTVATPRAGLLAACGLAASPVFLFHAIQPMSDVPTTAWWLLSLAAALRLTSVPGIAASGLCAGAAILTRPNLAPLALVVLAVALVARRAAQTLAQSSRRAGQHDGAWPRQSIVAAAAFVAAAVPGVAAVAWFNARLYGSPLVSGYGATGDLFSLSFVPLNAARYAGWLLDVHPVGALALVVAVVISVLSWRAAARGPDAPGARALFVPSQASPCSTSARISSTLPSRTGRTCDSCCPRSRSPRSRRRRWSIAPSRARAPPCHRSRHRFRGR